MLVLDRGETTDAGPEKHADPRRVSLGDRQLRIVHGELRRGNRVLNEDVHLLDILLRHELKRIEVLYLAGDLRGILGRIEVGYTADAAPPCRQRTPVLAG